MMYFQFSPYIPQTFPINTSNNENAASDNASNIKTIIVPNTIAKRLNILSFNFVPFYS
ncbi:hypothetical protein GU335_07330 [Pseudolactococcus raffinolactis]|uniref:hypothetical protein n=1 Tax=Pseudolactococcus raffinolactis TaxID=1366 RepID=UPI00143732F8|nr:hypothetical protein [Lactococcus raffinolactis]QIW56399.1 hypothetical protein GU335_07330 [Lactococcus raffinolactis]